MDANARPAAPGAPAPGAPAPGAPAPDAPAYKLDAVQEDIPEAAVRAPVTGPLPPYDASVTIPATRLSSLRGCTGRGLPHAASAVSVADLNVMAPPWTTATVHSALPPVSSAFSSPRFNSDDLLMWGAAQTRDHAATGGQRERLAVVFE